MAATSGYQAGTESNQVVISYAPEATWGTPPAVEFQAIRLTSETLAGTKTRSRPAELNVTGEVSASITTQETAGGDLSFALSFATYDDFLAGALNNDWQAKQTIAGVAADITLTTVTNVLSSTTAGKFTAIAQGQWIRLLGFTNAVNNGIFRVLSKVSAQSLVLSGAYVNKVLTPFVTETPTGVLAQIRASTLINSNVFHSYYVQKKFGPALFTTYGGSYVSTATLTGGTGSFLSGTFTLMSQQELSGTTDASVGGTLAAPSGLVNDPVAGFTGIYLNEAPISGVVNKFTLSFASTGAAMEYGMGTAAAQGVIEGLMEVTGTMDVYFKDFTLYQRFKSETLGALEFITKDAAGNAYVITILNCALMNPKINAGGQNQAVMASFTLEGNPQAGGGSVQIDRLPST